ncbi:hypothetical protein D3C84_1121920 [compost metagenome]
MTGPSTFYNDGVTAGHWAGLPLLLLADFGFGIGLGHESRQAITIDKRLLYLNVRQAQVQSLSYSITAVLRRAIDR